MAKNWAITIGVNQYDYLQPLKYAKRDAQLMRDYLLNEAKFDCVYFFSDDSANINGFSTRPNRANLRNFLISRFDKPFMGVGDNFWFFYSGHGSIHADRDYLMPSDGNPRDVEETAIPINFVSERLRRSGAGNVFLVLDACRNRGAKSGEGVGRQTAKQARRTGVISIFSCSPNEYSYEIEVLQQGAFTTALLEGLRDQGRCATVDQLDIYLNKRVPEIVYKHKNTRQTPYIIAEPIEKAHLIIVPQHAKQSDIYKLKNDASRSIAEKDFDLAQNLWLRVLEVSSNQDKDAIKALQKIQLLRERRKNVDSFPPTPSELLVERTNPISQKSNLPKSTYTEQSINEKERLPKKKKVTNDYDPKVWIVSGIAAMSIAAGIIVKLSADTNQQTKDNSTTQNEHPTSTSTTIASIPFTSLVPTDIEAILTTVPEITDPSQLRALNRQLYNQINPTWTNRNTLSDANYRLAVVADGTIVGYKPVDEVSNDTLSQTPLPKLVDNSGTKELIKNEPIAQFKVTFKKQGVLEVSPWLGYSKSPSVTREKIKDSAQLKKLQQKLYSTIGTEWSDTSTFSVDLKYRITMKKDGAIVDYEPLNKAAYDFYREIPLPKIFQEANSSDSAMLNSNEPLADFEVIFKANRTLEIQLWQDSYTLH